MSTSELRARAAAVMPWLFDAALPLWANAGFDAKTGLFAEKLDLQGRPVEGPLRVRVQARQAYVFAEAGRLGWPGPWRERVAAGLETLAGRARASGGASGHLLDGAGKLIDARRDLYDQAFALFALAHARAIDSAKADRRIGEILAYLETQRAPAGGFYEGELKAQPRRQNPHMHLFEAGMALIEAGLPQGRALAQEMVRLFDRAFFDSENGALGEYYDADWARAAGELGHIAEPGHHFEWIWLLDRWRRCGGEDREAACAQLFAHARANGIANGVAVYEARREGGIKTPGARLWAQTERLKAALVRFERRREAGDLAECLAAYDGLDLFFRGVPAGLWRDWMEADGTFRDEPAPASSFYHIVLAFSELLRLAAKL